VVENELGQDHLRILVQQAGNQAGVDERGGIGDGQGTKAKKK